MKLRIIILAMLTLMLAGCMTNPTVPSDLELASSKNIDQFINNIEH